MKLKTGRFSRIVLLHVAAVAVAVVAATASPFRAAAVPFRATDTVSATNHCTNYFPTSYTYDHNCDLSGGGTNGWIPAGSWGQTVSTALRDSNCMYAVSQHGLEVWYGEYTPSYAYSTNVCLGSSIGYQYSGCKNYDSTGVTGRCVTLWHN